MNRTVNKLHVGFLGILLMLVSACGSEQPQDPAQDPVQDSTSPKSPEVATKTTAGSPSVENVAGEGQEFFLGQAAEVGLDFVHFNGMSGEFYYSEHMGASGALFDFDQDGDLDLYLTQGHILGPNKTLEDATFPPREPRLLKDRLYRNDLELDSAGSPRLKFTDVTEESKILASGYGMGVAVGDYNNDGWPDLYVTNWGTSNQLFKNLGDGTFREVTAETGVGESRWSIATLFLDYDRDGWLDLFVTNYLNYSFSIHKECVNDIGLRDYCGPVSFDPVSDVLFRNRGDGTFEDVTGKAGLSLAPAPSLGAVSGDFNHDGWLDIYVANDEYANQLLINQTDGTFSNEALISGSAMNAEGRAEAGMGVDAADFDNDGDEDLFISHLNQETNTLYVNDSQAFFDDRTIEKGLASPSFDFTGFGTGFLDYDNDGWLDLMVANGAVQGLRPLILAGDPFPQHQKNQLFKNLRNGSFEEVSSRAGEAFDLSEVSRGVSFGDLDNDGDTDMLIHNNAGPLRVLLNQVGQTNAWVGLRLVGGQPQRDMLGSEVELLGPGLPQIRRVRTEGSYASARDPRVLFGLGEAQGNVHVRVTWVDGLKEEWDDIKPGRYTTLTQGTGKPSTPERE